jgi:hypothetical protein
MEVKGSGMSAGWSGHLVAWLVDGVFNDLIT